MKSGQGHASMLRGWGGWVDWRQHCVNVEWRRSRMPAPVTPTTLERARLRASPSSLEIQATSPDVGAERVWEETPQECRRQVIHLLGHLLYKQAAAGAAMSALASPAGSSREVAHERPAAHS